MITFNVLRRTFMVRYNHSRGTAFAIDVENKQYLITARHLCESIVDGEQIAIMHKGRWESIRIRVVGLGATNQIDKDVAVLAPEMQVAPSDLVMPATNEGLVLGQDLYFLGFPYGISSEAGGLNEEYPIPLIKRALLSGYVSKDGATEVFLLDGHNNIGFSGGPVVYRRAGRNQENFRVAAIVSGFRTENTAIQFKGQQTGLTSAANTGIVVCPSIRQVNEIIAGNPIGVDIAQ